MSGKAAPAGTGMATTSASSTAAVLLATAPPSIGGQRVVLHGQIQSKLPFGLCYPSPVYRPSWLQAPTSIPCSTSPSTR